MEQDGRAIEPGDTVRWTTGNDGGLGGTHEAEVLETGINKFGYSDVIKVDGRSGEVSDGCYIRPEDVIAVVE